MLAAFLEVSQKTKKSRLRQTFADLYSAMLTDKQNSEARDAGLPLSKIN